jgi:hypothetical protein
MFDFYDVGYSEPGLTTQLPDDKQLETGFKGSEKAFTYHTSILSALKVPPEWENSRFWSKLGGSIW